MDINKLIQQFSATPQPGMSTPDYAGGRGYARDDVSPMDHPNWSIALQTFVDQYGREPTTDADFMAMEELLAATEPVVDPSTNADTTQNRILDTMMPDENANDLSSLPGYHDLSIGDHDIMEEMSPEALSQVYTHVAQGKMNWQQAISAFYDGDDESIRGNTDYDDEDE